jgi:drug/metabolite transporter (DMT)-like permease
MLTPPMLPLALATLFSASFSLAIRFSQKRGANMTAVAAVNYIVAAAFHAVATAVEGFRVPHASTLLVGIAGGIAYPAAFFLLEAFMARRGVSVTGAVTRLSVLVPVSVSLAAWGERASALQGAGIGLAVLSLPLLSLGRQHARDPAGAPTSRAGRGAAAALLGGLFVVNGLCLLAPRAFRQTGVSGEDALFLFILFSTAALCSSAAWAVQEARARAAPTADAAGSVRALPGAGRPSLLASAVPGIAVGLCNALANRFVVASLVRLPGIIVYPFYSAVGLLLTVAFSALAWKERIRPLEAAGMGLALASIVLVNLR